MSHMYDIFPYAARLPKPVKFLSDLGIPDSGAVLILAIVLPVLVAAAVFVCLRRAAFPRKFAVFFSSMLIFVLTSVFILSDLKNFVSSLGLDVSELPADLFDTTGLLAASALGVVFFGVNSLICSNGITKRKGRIALLLSTLFFFLTESSLLLSLFSSESSGSESVLAFSFSARNSGRTLEIGLDLLSLIILTLYLVAGFLCFTANKSRSEITEDNRILFRKLSTDRSSVFGCEKNCASCQFGTVLTDSNEVLCEKKGITRTGQKCHLYIYDPLKRLDAVSAAAEDKRSDGG